MKKDFIFVCALIFISAVFGSAQNSTKPLKHPFTSEFVITVRFMRETGLEDYIEYSVS